MQIAECLQLATAIAFGSDPTTLGFSQREMRGHLVKCFNNKTLSQLIGSYASCNNYNSYWTI